MRLSLLGALRDGPSGLLRVRQLFEIKSLILRSEASRRTASEEKFVLLQPFL
jgi:hypothetical protein